MGRRGVGAGDEILIMESERETKPLLSEREWGTRSFLSWGEGCGGRDLHHWERGTGGQNR